MLPRRASYHTVVIGGGLGGLLAAGVAARSGRSVLVVERLPYLGGRFTTVAHDSYEITTGAMHLVPHGPTGILARLLRDLGVPHEFVRRDVLASFHHKGRHLLWRNLFDIPIHFGARTAFDLLKIVARLELRPPPTPDPSFEVWLHRQTSDPLARRIADRVVEFSLSVESGGVTCAAVRGVVRNTLRYGLPRLPVGGCKAVTDSLVAFLEASGVDLCVRSEAIRILVDDRSDQVRGVIVRDRTTGVPLGIEARTVVSDVGPRLTASLMEKPDVFGQVPVQSSGPAFGMKLHLVSPTTLIPHNGVTICLDTERICGMVQVSNAVSHVAPPGFHLIDTFQVLKSSDVTLERRLAMEDLRKTFGSDVVDACRVVRASAFRGNWPVNRRAQGEDAREPNPIPGLIMVGDAYKPDGFLMAEGVAASVDRVAGLLG